MTDSQTLSAQTEQTRHLVTEFYRIVDRCRLDDGSRI